MKKLKEVAGCFLLCLFLILLIPLLLLLLIFFVPFEFLRYRRMAYRKDLKKRYHPFITTLETVKFYNLIKEQGLPYTYVANGDFEYFIKDGTVLLPGLDSEMFEERDGEWYYNGEDEDEESEESDKRTTVADILVKEGESVREEHKGLPLKFLLFYPLKNDENAKMLANCPYFECLDDKTEK